MNANVFVPFKYASNLFAKTKCGGLGFPNFCVRIDIANPMSMCANEIKSKPFFYLEPVINICFPGCGRYIPRIESEPLKKCSPFFQHILAVRHRKYLVREGM